MSSIILNEKDVKSSKIHNSTAEQGTSYEVFRNNTTAVEVVVKDVLRSRKKSLESDDIKINRYQADIENLQCDLDKAKKQLAMTRKRFHTVVREMRHQLEATVSRESETQAANLALKLENEKLKILLESKTKLLCRSKKELTGLKRVLKTVVKSICNAPKIPRSVERGSDTEYEEFESELRSITPLKSGKTLNKTETFDTTASLREQCFDKKE